MANLRTTGAVTIDYSVDGWSAFKKWLDGTYASLHLAWVDEGSAYSIAAMDGNICRACSINKADAADFEANFKTTTAVGSSVLLVGSDGTATHTVMTDAFGRLVTTTTGVAGASSPIYRGSEFAITSRAETTVSAITYTITTGKNFYLNLFACASSGPLPTIFRLKVAGGSTQFMITSSGNGSDGRLALPAAILIGTSGQAITVTSEAQVPRGQVWVGFSGVEL